MFELEVKELYKYLTKNELKDSFSILKQERKSIVQYVIGEYKWVLVPFNSKMIKKNYETCYKIKNLSNIFFINNLNFGEIKNKSMCRRLTKEDKVLFKEFKNSCSKEDKDEGMVSLDDPHVYGLFDDGKIVAVSSLWNWGDVISDVGILVHPDYRKKGYAKTVCQTLMSNVNKKFVWRCDEVNKASYNLAISIGFTHYGLIQELEANIINNISNCNS